MREIKFRAWDSSISEMVSNNCLSVVAGEPAYIMEQNDGSLVSSFRQDMILMQYTGLKDKNGVEIYEGDIVGIENENWIVEWCDAGTFVVIEPCSCSVISTMQYLDDGGVFKVIGNVYENPELL